MNKQTKKEKGGGVFRPCGQQSTIKFTSCLFQLRCVKVKYNTQSGNTASHYGQLAVSQIIRKAMFVICAFHMC